VSINVSWWESSITDHQLHTLKELSLVEGINLSVFALSTELNDRKRQGWTPSDLSSVNGKILGKYPFSFLFSFFYKETKFINIFGGPFDSWVISVALFLSLIMGRKTFILTEPFSPLSAGLLKDGYFNNFPIIGILRAIKHKILWWMIKDRVAGIFAISKLAVSQLINFDVDNRKIFPFGYFVPTLNHGPSEIRIERPDGLKVVFVGSINRTKGVDLAVAAVDKLCKMGRSISLDLYGSGNIENLDLPKCGVSYKGTIPFGNSQGVICNYDCLILPSRYDGWGVVVNEALLVEVPVICSRQAGASVLIDRWGCGTTFDVNIKDSLFVILDELIDRRAERIKEWRLKSKFVKKIISPNVGAMYIADALFDRFDNRGNAINSTYQ
jgi:glycosyltransferase involved in cell wall biosynthesis